MGKQGTVKEQRLDWNTPICTRRSTAASGSWWRRFAVQLKVQLEGLAPGPRRGPPSWSAIPTGIGAQVETPWVAELPTRGVDEQAEGIELIGLTRGRTLSPPR